MTSQSLAAAPLYDRVVVKISGESLGESELLDPQRFVSVAQMIASLHAMGVTATVVVGGGNIFRGAQAGKWKIERTQADLIGMTATGLNVLILEGLLQNVGIETEVFSRGPSIGIGKVYHRGEVLSSLKGGAVVLLAGGLGISGISTDVTAVHAAIDTDSPAVIMSKHGVDGVYSDDPRTAPSAVFLATLTASEALDGNLRVMDTTALALAREHGKLIHVIPATETYAPRYVLEGKEIGSRIFPI